MSIEDMYVNLEDGGGGAATAPNPGAIFRGRDGIMVFCFGVVWVTLGMLFALLGCCGSYLIDGCSCRRAPIDLVIATGCFAAIGCAFWVCLALRFCCCRWSSGCMDRRHDGLLDVEYSSE
jgi:hypothetical protein